VEIKARSVVRVIIAGEWIWVEPGSFTVTDFAFTDEYGNPLNTSSEPAYYFTSTNGDPYFGPLSAIQLIKLRAAELEVGNEADQPRGTELPAAGEATPSAEPPVDEYVTADAAEPKAAYSADDLFSDPVPGPATETGGGLL
jgi:hypothetical protein